MFLGEAVPLWGTASPKPPPKGIRGTGVYYFVQSRMTFPLFPQPKLRSNFMGKSAYYFVQSRMTFPLFPLFMASKPFSNSV